MSVREAYQKKLKSQIKQWNAKIDEMKAKAEGASADTQLEYYKIIEDLRQKQQDLEERITELEESSEDAWEDIKVGIESSWKNLEFAFDKATSRFNS